MWCTSVLESGFQDIGDVKMTVKEFLQKQENNIYIKVYQTPIKKIDSCTALVKRYEGSVLIAVESNVNYLEYDMEYYYTDHEILFIICKPNKEQEMETINAYYDGR